jgi:ubiquinone/menaquinone biosynthesis C-methylase UbiE
VSEPDDFNTIVATCWELGDIDSTAASLRGENRILRALEPIGPSGHVLVVGAGDGNSAMRLAAATGARVASVDLDTANAFAGRDPAKSSKGSQVSSQRGDLTALPFGDATFSHGWSRASLLMTREPRAAIAELARVVEDGAIIVFDELVRPSGPGEGGSSTAADGSKSIHLPLSTSLRRVLGEAGLMVVEAEDWTDELRRTCEARASGPGASMPQIAAACRRAVAAIDAGEVGRSFLKAIRVYDPLRWLYQRDDAIGLVKKYDAVANAYDLAVGAEHIRNVEEAARQFVRRLGNPAGAVLDIGCGTGLVGAALRRAGQRHLIGLDPSSAMIEVCSGRGIYDSLITASIDDWDALHVESVDGAIAVGVFTHGHVPFTQLPMALRPVRVGGLLGVSLREDVAASGGLAEAARTLQAEPAGTEPVGQFEGHAVQLHLWRRT